MRNTHQISQSEYYKIHYWLRRNFEKPIQCENKSCEGKSKRYEWALKHRKKYEKKRENFINLCKSCHSKYDITDATKEKISRALKGKPLTKKQSEAHYIPILQFDLQGNFLSRFSSTKEAIQSLNLPLRSNLVAVLKGRKKTCMGYIWKYEDESKQRRYS